MLVDDDLDDDRTVTVAFASCWACGEMRNERCTGLYHQLAYTLSKVYPPRKMREEYDTFRRLKIWPFVCGYRSLTKWQCRCGSLAHIGPIVDGDGTVWNPVRNGHLVSFGLSSVVFEADQKRMKADMLDQIRNARPAFPTLAEDTEGTSTMNEYSEATEDRYSDTTEDAETTEVQARRLLDCLLRESVGPV